MPNYDYDNTVGKLLKATERLREREDPVDIPDDLRDAISNLFEVTALRVYEMYNHVTDGAFDDEMVDLWYQDFFTIADLILTEPADADIIVELDEQKEEHDDAGTA